jgi:hypothetical protein
MNKEELFDEWVRGTLGTLDTPPKGSDTGALWQKIQADLHEKPKAGAMWLRAKALWQIGVAAILCLAIGLGWYGSSPRSSTPLVVGEKRMEKPTPATSEATDLPSLARLGAAPSTYGRGSTESKLKVVTTRYDGQEKTLADSILPNQGPVLEAFLPSSELLALSELAPLPPEEAPMRPIPSTKPIRHKFKVVHIHEIDQYQQAELAEIESQKRPFIVVNLGAKSTPPPDRTILDYLKIN